MQVNARSRLRDLVDQVGPREVERKAAKAADLDARVPEVDVVTRSRKGPDVDVEVLDEAVAHPQLAVRVAVDAGAGRRIVVGVARCPGVRSLERRDRVVDRDVEVVHRDREARRPARLEHDAVRVRVRGFRRQVRVAALEELVLAGRAVERRRSDLARRHARRDALRGARLRVARGRAAGIARRVEQVEALRREELDDVRRTDCALVTRPQADVGDRRPLEAELVGIGLLLP